MNCRIKTFSAWIVFSLTTLISVVAQNAENPFLRPGYNKPSPPKVIKPAPPPPSPIPRNTNLEFRGYFKFQDQWNFSVFDKAKNTGVWLKKGELSDDGTLQVVGFDPEKSEIRLKDGMRLTLKDADKRVLAVPSGQISPPKVNPKTVLPSSTPRTIPPPARRR